MKEQQRQYPLFSACGLNCGLCPRHHTDGASRCPGCGGVGFAEKRPSCGIISCCRRHGEIEFCLLCPEFPCPKYDGAVGCDSFITHRHMLLDAEKVKADGLDVYKAQLEAKMALLQDLLEHYNDGRKKSFYCLAVNLLELPDMQAVMEQLKAEATPQQTPKEKAALAQALFEAMANRRGVALVLNTKKK